jgi:hypothetical protein
LAYAVFKFQYNPSDKTPEPVQLFRSCLATLISIRNSLEAGAPISQLSLKILTSMLSDLRLILNSLKQLSFAKDEEKLAFFKRRLIAVIPDAASALDSGIPFRRLYEKYVKNPDELKMARKALQECGSACSDCSTTLDSILRDAKYSPILRRLGLDK